MGKDKQYWSVAETISLLKLWSSLRPQLDRATRTKDSYEEIQRALAAQGHERELEQIVNKIKKLKMEFKEMNRSELDRDYWLKRNLYFDFLEKAFGHRGEGQATESDEDNVLERSSADDMEQLRKAMQENGCLLRLCPAADTFQRPRKSKDITKDIQSQDQTLNREHRDHGQSPDQNLRTKTNLDTEGNILGDREGNPHPCTSVTVKTEYTEDVSSIISSTNNGPSCSKGGWFPLGVQNSDIVKMEPTENEPLVHLSPGPALCSSDFKIEYVVTEDDFISFSVPSPGPVCPVQKMNSDKWLDAEVQALLSLYATKKMHQDFAGQKHNMRIFEKISHDLENIGIHHTTKQCREKVKKLKQDYKKIKEINESGAEFKKSKWFNILDSILGHHPDDSGSGAATSENSPMEPLESIFSEHNAERESSEGVLESANNGIQLSIDPVLKLSGDKWFDAEVKALVSLYATKEMERDSEGQTNSRIYEKISSDLANIGIHHSAKQCREKIKKLKQDYRKIKEHNNQYGAEIKTSKWYDILESTLGHLPAYSGSATADNPTREPLESVCRENFTDAPNGLDYLSKSTQIQPCFERLLGSAHPAFASGDTPKPALPLQNRPSGNAAPDSIRVECSTEPRESTEDNHSIQLCFEPAFKTNNDKWHDAEVQAFLGIYATKKMQQDSEGQTRTKIFPGISRELAKIGIHRTARHCREKIKKLKQDYRRIKSHNESGAQFKKGKWYNALDSILGHDLAYSASAAVISDNSSVEPMEENSVISTESFGRLVKSCPDQPCLDGPLESAPVTLARASTPKPASLASNCPGGNAALGTTRTEGTEEAREESVSEPEVDSGQIPHLLQRPVNDTVPCHPAVRSTAFHFRPVKRKRKESSELVECLERMHEQYLQHSRDMHEALLNRMDAHMTTVIGLMGRMAAAMEAQAAKQPPPK
uniref:Myb-like domain-containing protein n=1 Tax=Neogobius melanostomus TaxID=47308 RepID=A0A8C6SJX6_9GOBI